jgi:hypothetical protein
MRVISGPIVPASRVMPEPASRITACSSTAFTSTHAVLPP